MIDDEDESIDECASATVMVETAALQGDDFSCR
jgi:hypothetical protein